MTEHLCALITHNEARKAKKLETLMLELASDSKTEINNIENVNRDDVWSTDDDEKPVIIDGVDQKTGKMVEFTESWVNIDTTRYSINNEIVYTGVKLLSI